MPRIPVYDGPQVAQAPMPGVGDAVSGSINDLTESMLGLGKAASKLMLDAEASRNQAAAKDADTKFTAGLSDLLHNPESGYLVKQGKNAVDAYSPTVEAIQKLRSDTLFGLDPVAQKALQPVLDDRIQSAMTRVQTFAGQQGVQWRQQSAQSRAEVSIQDAALNYRDDGHFSRSLSTALNEVDELGAMNGWDQSTTTAQRSKLIDQAFRGRYDAWRQENAAEALVHFQRHATSISPLMRDQIGRELFTAATPQLAEMVNQAGGVERIAAAPGAVTLSSSGAPAQGVARTEPRGIRNNNPGNIMKGPREWQGEIPGGDTRYATFASPEAGIRAMGKLLLTYQDKHGLETVEGIIARWAPATENDTGAYAAAVAKAAGVKPDAKLDMHDPATLGAVVRAMIHHENGKQPYTQAQIDAGLTAAMSNSSLPEAQPKPATGTPATVTANDWRDPGAKTGIAVIDTLPPDQRIRVLQLAQSQSSQKLSQERADLAARAKDSAAEYLARGTASNPPSEAEFISAYGQSDGIRRYREMQDAAVLGSELQRIKGTSNAGLDKLLADAKPKPGDGFAERARNYQTLQSAVQQAREQRQADPVAYAIDSGSYGIKPFQSFNNPQGFMAELSRRAAAMPAIGRDYGTRPMLMTLEEAELFGSRLASLQTTDKARVLGQVFKAAGAAGVQSLSYQLKDKNNTLSVAAMLSAHQTNMGNSAALLYLQGRDAIAEKRAKIDEAKETGVLAEINTMIQGVYQTPQGQAAAAEAALGIYAKFRADGGGDVEQAVNIATGGLMDFNGARIAKPYGWADSRFRDAMKSTAAGAVKAKGPFIVGGQRITGSALAGMLPAARLQTFGPGSYLIRAGSDVVRSANGAPFILQMGP